MIFGRDRGPDPLSPLWIRACMQTWQCNVIVACVEKCVCVFGGGGGGVMVGSCSPFKQCEKIQINKQLNLT